MAAIRTFMPRLSFANALSSNLPRSYYLGHHESGFREISERLTNIDLIIECRDYRVPISSWNPHLDQAIAGRDRIVVYTHRDLGTDSPKTVEQTLRHYNSGKNFSEGAGLNGSGRFRSIFWRKDDPSCTKSLLTEIKNAALSLNSFIGVRALVVGMPNVGKSTLLNRLRSHGMNNKTKAARVGSHPGVTRKISGPVRILAADKDTDGDQMSTSSGSLGEGVFVLDTPGVFMPYVQEVEDMVKLSLVGCVKDDRVPLEILADYLLFRLNLIDPSLYSKYCEPTNEINDFLTAVAHKTGKLQAGGVPNHKAAADWVVKQWRAGTLGRFVLDDVSDDIFRQKEKVRETGGHLSINQARKREKALRKANASVKSKPTK